MFIQTVSVSMECQVHPDFMPERDSATKKCRACQVIANVYEWLRMADRQATRLKDGHYSSSAEPDTPAAPVDAVADVAGEGTAKKRAISTQVSSAPENFMATKVRRKL